MNQNLQQDAIRELFDYDPETGILTWRSTRRNRDEQETIRINGNRYDLCEIAQIYMGEPIPEPTTAFVLDDRQVSMVLLGIPATDESVLTEIARVIKVVGTDSFDSIYVSVVLLADSHRMDLSFLDELYEDGLNGKSFNYGGEFTRSSPVFDFTPEGILFHGWEDLFGDEPKPEIQYLPPLQPDLKVTPKEEPKLPVEFEASGRSASIILKGIPLDQEAVFAEIWRSLRSVGFNSTINHIHIIVDPMPGATYSEAEWDGLFDDMSDELFSTPELRGIKVHYPGDEPEPTARPEKSNDLNFRSLHPDLPPNTANRPRVIRTEV
jgi:hypothetical protein